jgi:integrase
VSYGGQRLTKFPTGETILPEFWDASRQRAKQSRRNPTFPEFNSRLQNIENIASNVLRQYQNDNNQLLPSIKNFRLLLSHVLNPRIEKKTEEITLFTFLDSYLKEYETRIYEKTGRPITSNTLRVYKQALRVLREFKDDTLKHRSLDFDNIDYYFYGQFQQYLVKRNFATNTIGKHIRTLKTFFLEAKERGLMPQFNSKKFRSISEPTDAVYLSVSEIEALYQLDLSQDRRLEKVRDLFIVACWTGLRFSDFTQIHKENVVDGCFELKTKKTGEKIAVPIHRQVSSIMGKYEGITKNSLPEPISNQKMNNYLKELGRLAGIDEVIATTITRGGITRTTSQPKYDLITTHTGRRSFATNHYLQGFPVIGIMRITGHRTEKAFMKYIKITPRDTADKLRELWSKVSEQETISLSIVH